MNHINEHSKTNGNNVNHLVHLRDAETESPVFCIHPSGGDVAIYRKLGRNLRDHMTIGIQSRMIFGLHDEYESVLRMAEVYADLIDQYQPTGPIRLLGFSFGGFIANAMVEKLKGLQREVGFFGVIDSDLRWSFDQVAVRSDLSARLEQVSLNLQYAGILKQLPREKVKSDIDAIVDMCLDGLEADGIANELQARGHTAQSDSDSVKFQNFIVRFAAHCRMIQGFQPTPMEIPIHCWWPSEGNDEHQQRSQCWQDLAMSGVSESTIEGSHYSIMKIPCVKKIATEIALILADSEDQQTQVNNQPLRNKA